ncbi:MAG: ABC transporter permease subunit [Gemmatimonas sp.]|nr:ABC transporter permease subunit [Gemmatimonas sp.]
MNALRGFILKEAHHILRDRQTLTILLLLPLAQVLLFGFALRTDVQNVRVAVVDAAPDYATRELRGRFDGTTVFEVVTTVPTSAALPPLFERGAIDQALVFGPRFAERLANGDAAELLVVTDATDPNTGSAMQAYATGVVQEYERELSLGRATGTRILPQVRMRFNPTLESVNLFIPGLIALVLTLVSALMSAISLSREKERGTLEVLLVSPLRPWQIIVGKVLPYLVLGVINVVTVLLAAWLVFDVPFRGSTALLFAECLLFIVTSLALGVLVAAVTSSQRTAMVGSLIALLLPTTLLSGMIFPIASMPAWLQPVSNIVPGKWFILIARGIMLKGVGLEHLWRETLVLAAITTLVLVIAVRRFDIRLESS